MAAHLVKDTAEHEPDHMLLRLAREAPSRRAQRGILLHRDQPRWQCVTAFAHLAERVKGGVRRARVDEDGHVELRDLLPEGAELLVVEVEVVERVLVVVDEAVDETADAEARR